MTSFRKFDYLVIRGLSPGFRRAMPPGLGLVEFCRSDILRDMDVHATRTNCLTGSHATAAMIPLDYETDREILDVVLSVNGLTPPEAAQIMWIENTLKFAEVECS